MVIEVSKCIFSQYVGSAFISMTLHTSPWLLYCVVSENWIVAREPWSTFCDLRCCLFMYEEPEGKSVLE